MEDVLEVYKRPYDPQRPVACLDETSKQLVGETRTSVPGGAGPVAHYDSEYVRKGVANLFMLFEPLAGQRDVVVTEQRTEKDHAQRLRQLSDEKYPHAEIIVLVQDNLNTYSPASLYEAFEAAEAQRLTRRFEWHYTPKHDSWLDIAEIELGILSQQCLSQRIDTIEKPREKTAAWENRRDQAEAKVDWQFTMADARTKLKHLYPSMDE